MKNPVQIFCEEINNVFALRRDGPFWCHVKIFNTYLNSFYFECTDITKAIHKDVKKKKEIIPWLYLKINALDLSRSRY